MEIKWKYTEPGIRQVKYISTVFPLIFLQSAAEVISTIFQ